MNDAAPPCYAYDVERLRFLGLLGLFGALGCGGAVEPTSEAPTAATATPWAHVPSGAASAARPEPTPAPTDAALAPVGVPVCDDYLAFMRGCVGKLPESSRAAIVEALEQAQRAWADERHDPEAREGFAEGCRVAMESMRSSGLCGP
jgi:hypothetical protein